MNELVLMECLGLVFGYSKGKSSSGYRKLCEPFDFALHSGEVVALLGENGCGKSTFLRTLCGMLPPVQGELSLMGRPLTSARGGVDSWSARERAKRIALVRMGYLPSDRMTVREFVGLGRIPYTGIFDGRRAEDLAVVNQSLELMDVGEFAYRPVCELSDGERSRVYLAQALAQQVRVLLLDEPNAFLDIPRSRKLFSLLKKMAAERGMGIIVSTHSVHYAELFADRIMVIGNGLVQVANAKEAQVNGLLDWTEKDC